MNLKKVFLLIIAFLGLAGVSNAKSIDVMLITGHTDKHHNWEIMSACLTDVLSEYEAFNTDVVLMTEPWESFSPNFSDYDVVVFNINDVQWSDQTKKNFEDYMHSGGGLVVVHEADNAFATWTEFNRMICLGGWGQRTEKDGPYYYWKDDEFIFDHTPGKAGKHGARVPFEVNVRNSKHPIMKGLPTVWTQNDDELYGNLRGPAENMEILATGFSESKSGGTGKEEPLLFTIAYGKGRVFHTTLGHTTKNFTKAVRENKGFQVTFSRGVEWAATGKVKQKNDVNF